MHPEQVARAVTAAACTAATLGLDISSSTVLHASNAVTVHLLPGDVVARVAPALQVTTGLEVDVAVHLERVGAPLVPLDSRVPPALHTADGFVITFWAHCKTSARAGVGAGEYAAALHRLHAALAGFDGRVPHVTDRVRAAEDLLARVERTPGLTRPDRTLLQQVLAAGAARVRRAGDEQVLHGKPHPGNVLLSEQGPVFIDWETVCRGPVEYDLAHAPQGVGEAYPQLDQDLLRDCRLLARAVATTWRYDVDDQLPGGRELGRAWLQELRGSRSSR